MPDYAVTEEAYEALRLASVDVARHALALGSRDALLAVDRERQAWAAAFARQPFPDPVYLLAKLLLVEQMVLMDAPEAQPYIEAGAAWVLNREEGVVAFNQDRFNAVFMREEGRG
jgi:hypothetical protein